ncbi:MAG: DUF4491 family protein [Treponema sp.]|nr:DUF4491 family protein [Treponema sp.]
MNFDALIVGLASFAIIGVFHPIVIKAEYFFSSKIWPLFLIVGIIFVVISVFVHGILSYILALIGMACLWSIIELKHQKKRVEKGWFPRNPNRKE